MFNAKGEGKVWGGITVELGVQCKRKGKIWLGISVQCEGGSKFCQGDDKVALPD